MTLKIEEQQNSELPNNEKEAKTKRAESLIYLYIAVLYLQS